jgi:rare lipoprotein A (peptidoglycan hydrolase)
MGRVGNCGRGDFSDGVENAANESLGRVRPLFLPSKCPNRSMGSRLLIAKSWLQHIANDPLSRIMIVTALVATLCACSASKSPHPVDETQQLSPRVIRVGDPVPKGGGVWKLGEPYLAAGKWYIPVNDQSYDRVGLASWYGDFFHGRPTANGEIYDMNALSGAHPTLPLPTYVTVTNLANNRTVVVRINDRGPYHDGRIIDLSHRAARELGFYGHGTAAVRVRYLRPAPLNGDDSFERSVLAQQPWAAHVLSRTETPNTPKNNFLAAAVMTEWPLVVKKGGFEGRRDKGTSTWLTNSQPVSARSALFVGPR